VFVAPALPLHHVLLCHVIAEACNQHLLLMLLLDDMQDQKPTLEPHPWALKSSSSCWSALRGL
jgi:hypothetical protein